MPGTLRGRASRACAGVVAGALTAACTGAAQAPAQQQRSAPRLILTAAPQPGEVFLTWSGMADVRYVVRWRPATDQTWRTVDASTVPYQSIGGLADGVRYQFQVEAQRNGIRLGDSPIVDASPRQRPGCATLDYMPGPPRISFFCTKAALDAYLAPRGITPTSLRCRQQPVASWTPNVPDCLYSTPEGEQLLLLRDADSVFSGGDHYAQVADVRRHARFAIWGTTDPFQQSARARHFTPREPALVGRVSKYAAARSYHLTSEGVSSRVTWFVPRSPAPRRFAIYHEGHGGAAIEIGAGTIDWLLERGWQVIAMDMPLLGHNAEDQTAGLTTHNEFDRIDHGSVSPISRFVMPVKMVVDWIAGSRPDGERELLLIGRSGGGLTSYLYGALDGRVDMVVSVAGGRPISARLDAPWGAAELGDYEQTAPHLFNATGHEHLMSAAGTRGAFFIFNRWDGCCFRIAPNDPFAAYLTAAGRAGGRHVGVFVDEANPGHSIGPDGYVALDRYLRAALARSLP